MTRRHLVAVVVLPLLAILAMVGYLLIVQDHLPDRVATHWGPGGDADGFTSKRALAPLFGGLTLIVSGLLAAISIRSPRAIVGRPLVGLANALAWFMVTLVVGTTVPQLNGEAAGQLPGWIIPVAATAGVVGFVVALVVAGDPQRPTSSDAPAPRDADRIELPTGHTAVWSGRTPSASAALVIGLAVVALGIGLAAAASWWLLTILLPVAVLVIGSSSYRVTIGPRAVDVSGMLFGFPRIRVPMSEVARADAGTVDAWSFGGWGIRIGANDESAVVTRSGPALVITRTDGAILRVSLDEPERAAATIATLLDRRGSAPGPDHQPGRTPEAR